MRLDCVAESLVQIELNVGVEKQRTLLFLPGMQVIKSYQIGHFKSHQNKLNQTEELDYKCTVEANVFWTYYSYSYVFSMSLAKVNIRDILGLSEKLSIKVKSVFRGFPKGANSNKSPK